MKLRRFLPHVVFIILVAAFVLLNQAGLKSDFKQNKTIQPSGETAKVVKVIDGDTLEVSLNNKIERIRLIGIDSPEVLDERKPVQCFGKEASNKAGKVVTGKTIVLESDPTQENMDEYGRLLRYVFLDDLNFNKLMVSEGYAHEYTFKGNIYKYQSEFVQAEKEARDADKGLWSQCPAK